MSALPTTPLGGELAKAVVAVMLAVKNVEKTGKNDFHKYEYASEADFLRALQPVMAANGLAVLPTADRVERVEGPATGKGKAQWITTVTTTYTLIHTSGESLELQSTGCGIDGEDKGVPKAKTGALKYLLRQMFLLPTGDDPDQDHDGQGGGQPASASKPAATQGSQQPAASGNWWQDVGYPKILQPVLEKAGLDFPTVAGFCEGHGKARPSRMPEAELRQLCDYITVVDTQLTRIGLPYDDVAAWCKANGRPVPLDMDADTARKLVDFLVNAGGADRVREHVKAAAGSTPS